MKLLRVLRTVLIFFLKMILFVKDILDEMYNKYILVYKLYVLVYWNVNMIFKKLLKILKSFDKCYWEFF